MKVISRRADAFNPIVKELYNKSAHSVWRAGNLVTRKFSNGYILVTKPLPYSGGPIPLCEALVYAPYVVYDGSHLLGIGPEMTPDEIRRVQLIIEYFTEGMDHGAAISRLKAFRGRDFKVMLYEDRAEVLS